MNNKQKGTVIFFIGLIQSAIVVTDLSFELFQLIYIWSRWVGPALFLMFWLGVILMITGVFTYFHQKEAQIIIAIPRSSRLVPVNHMIGRLV
ncbi:hypothetical protein ATDW_35810 (plasmid) [Asticcacaulis sp. DW145]|uniref:Uncharacterized protein n=1 Tax=Asticcacaulis currens TaxID=2984210 RepID=A0ABT5IE30_9CAUL|nr:hypothetical protein [Asticcacaulis currens]MDC7694419.1 hypothetical protein [Asticcacaulis currens]BEV13085.1 hypothetical protein ATDW_35810 [Asticcacaulis sp. DW145]